MAGTRAGAIKGWLHRLEKKVNEGTLNKKWTEKLMAFKRRHNEELVDELNKEFKIVTDSDDEPYYLDENTLEVDGARFTNYIEDGVPPGGQVDDRRIKEWIIKVKHPDVNFFKDAASRRELDRIAFRIESKIRVHGIEARPHREAALEKLKRKYKNVRFGQRT